MSLSFKYIGSSLNSRFVLFRNGNEVNISDYDYSVLSFSHRVSFVEELFIRIESYFFLNNIALDSSEVCELREFLYL